jgi:hypothetical protein
MDNGSSDILAEDPTDRPASLAGTLNTRWAGGARSGLSSETGRTIRESQPIVTCSFEEAVSFLRVQLGLQCLLNTTDRAEKPVVLSDARLIRRENAEHVPRVPLVRTVLKLLILAEIAIAAVFLWKVLSGG